MVRPASTGFLCRAEHILYRQKHAPGPAGRKCHCPRPIIFLRVLHPQRNIFNLKGIFILSSENSLPGYF